MKGEYVAAGYYLTHWADRASYMAPELPDRVLSASACICVFFPDRWAVRWEAKRPGERRKKAAAFGLSPQGLLAATEWATQSYSKSFGHPNAFYSLKAAREARATFFPDDPELVTFGLGLNKSDLERFLTAAVPPPVSGVLECVSERKEIAAGGEAAGFELLVTQYGRPGCSWLCNGLERACAEELGIRTNRHGFVESYSDAAECARFISRPETRAEPGLWLPWLVTIYSDKA